MRVARVVTNETCNQNCGFCHTRRPAERPEYVRTAAVRARIAQALDAGAREVVLTGGEPALRRDLASLVADVRARGAAATLETNGALVTPALARELAKAGLSLARVHVPAWGAEGDAITQDDGGFDATLAGLRALAAEGLRLELAVPLVRANRDSAARIPAQVAAAGIAIDALVLLVPSEAPDESTLLDLRDAAGAIEAVETAARHAGIAVRLDAGTLLAPCLLPRPGRLAHLYALTPGGGARAGWVHPDGCDRCAVRDRCPGVPAAAIRRSPDLAVAPIEEDRLRRRLTVISSTREQIARELFTRDVYRAPDGEAIPSYIVRVNFQCNQACHFCFVSTHLPAPDDADVRALVEEIGRAHGVLQLSGGEPTLNARLLEYVRLGKASGARWVELQTNATKLADEPLVRALEDAGVDVAFVSLHGSTAEISDAVTAAPGTFEKTVRGLDALASSRIAVRLNFVFCEANREDFPRWVALAAERWPKAELNVSVVGAFTDVVPRTRALIPRYTDVRAPLEAGLALAARHGLKVLGFESMCGIPLCLAPGEPRAFLALAEIAPGQDGGEFVRAPACEACDLRTRCFGVRRSYAELHGTDELNTVAVAR